MCKLMCSIFGFILNIIFFNFFSASDQSEKNGEEFYCQHGPAECTGNRIQSCVLDALNNDQDAKVKFVTCQMKRNAEYSGKKVCRASMIWFLFMLFM